METISEQQPVIKEDKKPTSEQQPVIDEPGNCVILAGPGSGKTFTLAHKIQGILPNLLSFQGVIAISYTNKASEELKRRSLAGGVDKKSSYFGTIDKFILAEIIFPFGIHVFGNPTKDISVVDFDNLEFSEIEANRRKVESYREMHANFLSEFARRFRQGQIIFETIGFLAQYIFNNSNACKRYLKARYTHIFIDEYQDCGYWQHTLFISLVNLGLCGVVVGDENQSIYGFANRYPKYLKEIKTSGQFKPYDIEVNQRCHSSIVNYSRRLLHRNTPLLESEEIRVFKKKIPGGEDEIAQWLSDAIPKLVKKYEIAKLSDVAILVKNSLTDDLIHEHLLIPHKFFQESALERDSSHWGTLFKRILSWYFNPDISRYEFVEEYYDFDTQLSISQTLLKLLYEVELGCINNFANLKCYLDHFISFAKLVHPEFNNPHAISNLFKVLEDEKQLKTFIPVKPNEVQLMTLHKSKGLEFDLIFHLNLYEWILPQKEPNDRGVWKYRDYTQDLNLHYVGITRAKKCCILCNGSSRSSRSGTKNANDSEFLSLPELSGLRLDLDL